MPSAARSTAAVMLLAFVFACGPEPGDLPFERTERTVDAGVDGGADAGEVDAGPPPIPDEPLEDWDVEGAGPLSGIFAVELNVKLRAVVDLEAKQLYRMRVLQRGSTVRMRAEPCEMGLPSVPGLADLIIPERLLEVIRDKTVEEEGDFLSQPEAVGARIVPPRLVVVLGAMLEDEVDDPLPTADDLEVAFDEDEDGHPGVSVDVDTLLCRGEIHQAYTAVRVVADLRGTVEELDRVSGTIDAVLEPSFLGFSDDCLTAAAMLEVEPAPGSTWLGLRVGDDEDIDGNGNVSCPEISYYASRLFGDHWAE